MSASQRREAAREESTPPQTLEVLAGDPDDNVRHLVARNPNAPSQALEMLAGDGVWGVQYAVACNRTTPPHVLETLADDDDRSVRYAARGAVDGRIRECLGIDPRNTDAIDMLRSMPWWELARDDEQVRLVLALCPDPAGA